MPTILDATVVNQAYLTSASARPQLISDGSIIEAVFEVGYGIRFYKTSATGVSTYLGYKAFASGTTPYWTIAVKGDYLHFFVSHATYTQVIHWSAKVSELNGGEIGSLPSFRQTIPETGQTAFNGIDCEISGDYIYLSHASKNATYANSFNIRYAKGTIATDGSVAWGAVEQWTTFNLSSEFNQNPSIVLDKNGKPIVFVETYSGSIRYIIAINAGNTTSSGFTKNFVIVYSGASYAQSSPSAIFIPQSINGLANGRIWVAWHGRDATDTTVDNIRVSYSDDGGVTWSAMDKRTSGNAYSRSNVSLTANKINEIFIAYQDASFTTGAFFDIATMKNTNNVWGSATRKTQGGASSQFPSTLFDPTFNFSEPLFIYKNNAKVGFYGTWTVTTISVTQGSIGQKTDKSNLLTYAITTDGTMSTISEKVNGVTVGTKTATSGQSIIAGLTQAQWDAVKFGKYKDVTAGLNTLTIEMGTEIFTYTFDKRPASDADMLSVTKAVQDSANVSLPAKKSLVATAIRAKGGTVLDTDSLEVMASALSGLAVKRKATGTITSGASGATIPDHQGTGQGVAYVSFNMANLPFVPSIIEFRPVDKTNAGNSAGTWYKKNFYESGTYFANSYHASYIMRVPYTNGVVNIPVRATSLAYEWTAYEE